MLFERADQLIPREVPDFHRTVPRRGDGGVSVGRQEDFCCTVVMGLQHQLGSTILKVPYLHRPARVERESPPPGTIDTDAYYALFIGRVEPLELGFRLRGPGQLAWRKREFLRRRGSPEACAMII